MNTRSLKTICMPILTWALIVLAGLAVSFLYCLHYVYFFTLGLGIPALFSILALWWFTTGNYAQAPVSALLILVIITVKMLISGILLIYYFYHYPQNPDFALTSGLILFFIFSIIDIWVVSKQQIKK